MKDDDLVETRELVRRVLASVEEGELEVEGPVARAALRRLQGAAIALEVLTDATTTQSRLRFNTNGRGY